MTNEEAIKLIQAVRTRKLDRIVVRGVTVERELPIHPKRPDFLSSTLSFRSESHPQSRVTILCRLSTTVTMGKMSESETCYGRITHCTAQGGRRGNCRSHNQPSEAGHLSRVMLGFG
ncbi:hypothetical protein PIB30_091888 [Stylosanthes scabra]|uniref:Uncharacterized protein n=1 Tax=Stylosanthes scabra TaxID=79078 RepID=A0ABU6ZTN7_9FABA|nr:hypothetical protein [Stylosanthes scabra]